MYTLCLKKQEGPAVADKPARRESMPKLLQFDVLTTLSLTILVYLHSFSCSCVRNLRNHKKFSENSNLYSSRSSKVIYLGVNRKRICNFILVITSNFGRISCSFRDIDTLLQNSLFPPPHHCLTPPSRGTPCTINIFYTSLKSTFSGLQFCRRHYGSIFIHLAIVAFQNREITRNSDKI